MSTPARTSFRPLLAAWLGWTFDGLDGYLYISVAIPFVTQLVANEHGLTVDAVRAASMPEVIQKASIIQAVFLLGWAIGGVFFGRIGDKLGRSRTLTFTILTYAIFTGLAFFAQNWWHLLIFRFLAALGIGGEWAAGSALVAETLPKKHRDWASAVLQSGYIAGCIAAVLSATWITREYPHKYVFLIGVIPAFLTLWIRHSVPEPEAWKSAKAETRDPEVKDLFAPGLARTTILLLVHISIALTVAWAFLFFTPQAISKIPEVKNWTFAETEELKRNVVVCYFVVNIIANFVATGLAKAIGPKLTFAIFMSAALASLWFGFRTQPTLSNIYLITCGFAATGLGMFAIFPLYVPPLFPTLLRTLGAGLTYNFGRVTAAAGTMAAGFITTWAGGPAQAVFWIGLIYIPGIVVCMFLPTADRSEHSVKPSGPSVIPSV